MNNDTQHEKRISAQVFNLGKDFRVVLSLF